MKMAKKDCLERGGHCYITRPEMIATNPPKHKRVCKHCGHEQIGTVQPGIDWRDG